MKKILAGIAVLAVAAAAQADLLASWNFTGSTGSAWGAVEGGVAGTTGNNVASAVLTVENVGTQYGTGQNQLRINQAGWNTADGKAAGYIGVKLTAASGYELTVNEIDMRVNGSGAGLGGTAQWLDGSGAAISESWTTANNTSFKPTLTSNPSGSTVDLRLVATLTGGNWGLTGATGNNTSLAINGSTAEASAVPEPATMSLLGLGALAMVIRRKLRK